MNIERIYQIIEQFTYFKKKKNTRKQYHLKYWIVDNLYKKYIF